MPTLRRAYSLQRVEAYEGVVILATNCARTWMRRLPGASSLSSTSVPTLPARLIWQTHFPREAPVSAELDYDWLAQQLQITGGNIKNIVLNAAFFAAADGVIGMEHILRSARGEFEKIGKPWNE